MVLVLILYRHWSLEGNNWSIAVDWEDAEWCMHTSNRRWSGTGRLTVTRLRWDIWERICIAQVNVGSVLEIKLCKWSKRSLVLRWKHEPILARVIGNCTLSAESLTLSLNLCSDRTLRLLLGSLWIRRVHDPDVPRRWDLSQTRRSMFQSCGIFQIEHDDEDCNYVGKKNTCQKLK